uniref:CSON012273 protein n=1 Tax=Culicoides sonorensis TaxID=179676 RepID=A0A336K7J1_CULSO
MFNFLSTGMKRKSYLKSDRCPIVIPDGSTSWNSSPSKTSGGSSSESTSIPSSASGVLLEVLCYLDTFSFT